MRIGPEERAATWVERGRGARSRGRTARRSAGDRSSSIIRMPSLPGWLQFPSSSKYSVICARMGGWAAPSRIPLQLLLLLCAAACPHLPRGPATALAAPLCRHGASGAVGWSGGAAAGCGVLAIAPAAEGRTRRGPSTRPSRRGAPLVPGGGRAQPISERARLGSAWPNHRVRPSGRPAMVWRPVRFLFNF